MKTKFLINIATIFCLTLGFVEAKELLRKENYIYSANKKTSLNITNKFGNIKIENNDKNQIKIDIKITTDLPKGKEKYKKFLEETKIIHKVNDDEIKFYSDIPKHLKNKNLIKVDYHITLPTYVNLKLKNSFGDIIASEISANSEIQLAFGSLSISKLTEEKKTDNTTNIKLSFAKDCKIHTAQNIKLKLSHSECDIDIAKILQVNSSFSELDVDKVEKIEMNSKHDKVDIDELDDIFLDKCEFSTFDIDELHKQIKATIDFSKLKIDDVGKDFKNIDIEEKFGNVKICVNKDSKYFLDIDKEFGDIDLDHFILYDSTDGKRKKILAKSFIDIDTIDNKIKIIIKSKHGDVKIEKSE